MIMYLTSYSNQDFIKSVLDRVDEPFCNGEIGTQKDLKIYIKEVIAKATSIDVLIIDIQAVKEDGVYEAIRSVANTYDNTQIIIIDTSRVPGDELLSDIYELGIYDIITEIDEDELFKCIVVGKSETDAAIYHKKEIEEKHGIFAKFRRRIVQQNTNEQKESTDASPEPVIEPYRVQINEAHLSEEEVDLKAFRGEIENRNDPTIIDFVGTLKRIGTTSNMIYAASCLAAIDYKVAVCEIEQSTFKYIMNGYTNIEKKEDHFVLNKICFYQNTVTNQQDYDFILYDYGNNIAKEYNQKADQRILVSGSKAWEFEKLNETLVTFGINIEQYIHFFAFTSSEAAELLKETLGSEFPSIRLFFPEYIPDMFTPTRKQQYKLLNELVGGEVK